MTEVPSITRATEAPSSRETGTPSLATSETLRFSSVTKVSDSLATESSPVVETKAPSSLATEGPSSMATEAQSFPTEVPYVSTTHTQPSMDEGPVNFLTAHIPVPKSTDKEGSKSSATSVSPEKSLYSKMSLTQTGESLPLAQEEAEAEAELPEAEAELPEAEAELPEAEARLPEVEARLPGAEGELPEAEAELPVSSEVVVPVLPAQEHGGPQASLDHSAPPASTSLPNFPSVSAEANATGGRTLALQSPLTGKARSPSFPSWLGVVCWYQQLGHGKACVIWKMLPLPAACTVYGVRLFSNRATAPSFLQMPAWIWRILVTFRALSWDCCCLLCC